MLPSHPLLRSCPFLLCGVAALLLLLNQSVGAAKVVEVRRDSAGQPRVTLEYDVAHTEEPWRSIDHLIDTKTSVSRVECEAESDHARMHIHFTSREAMESEGIMKSMLLTSAPRREVRCTDTFLMRGRHTSPGGHPVPDWLSSFTAPNAPIYRRIISVVQHDYHINKTIVDTEVASPFDFFRDANVSVHIHHRAPGAQVQELTTAKATGARPSDDDKATAKKRRQMAVDFMNDALGYSAALAARESKRARRSAGWFDDALDWVDAACHTVQTIANVVAKVVKVVGWAADFLATGDVSGGYEATYNLFGYNYDLDINGPSQTSISLGNDFVCENCYSYINLEADFAFSVQSYSVSSVSVSAGGSAGLFLDVSWGPGSIVSEYEWDKVVDLPKGLQESFLIAGIPFFVKATLPVQVGGLLDVAASGQFRATASFSGSVQFGFEYSNTYGFTPINNVTFQHQGKLLNLDASSDVRTQFYVMPILQIDVDHIGGPYLSTKGYIEMQVSESLRENSVCPGSCQVSAGTQTNVGLDVNLGAAISISLAGKNLFSYNFGNATILSLKKPVSSQCICLSDGGEGTVAPESTEPASQPGTEPATEPPNQPLSSDGTSPFTTAFPATTWPGMGASTFPATTVLSTSIAPATTFMIPATTPAPSGSIISGNGSLVGSPSLVVVGDVWSGMSYSDLPSCQLVNNVAVSLQLAKLTKDLTAPRYFVGKINAWSSSTGAPCIAQMVLQASVSQSTSDSYQYCDTPYIVYFSNPCDNAAGATAEPGATSQPAVSNDDDQYSASAVIEEVCSNVEYNHCIDGSQVDVQDPFLVGCLSDTLFQHMTLFDKFGNPCFTIDLHHVTSGN